MNKNIMIVKPNTISDQDRAKLFRAGVLVVEHPLPGDVRLIGPEQSLSVDAILNAAAKAIKDTGTMGSKERFGKHLCDAIIAGSKAPL